MSPVPGIMLPVLLLLAAVTLPFSVSGGPILTCSDPNGVERSEGESWECEDGCNTCWCSGGQIASTLVLCQEPPARLTCTDHNGVQRSEGESWECEDGCNTCRCSAGQVASTIMLCEEPPAEQTCTDHNGVERSEGESWECEDGCNTCKCSAGQVGGTIMFCLEQLAGQTCTDHNLMERSEGESWECEDGCNTCRCSAGQVTSTIMLCEEPPAGQNCTDHNGVERSEGESWECEDGCNTCKCSAGQVGGTIMLCQEPPAGQTCTDHNGVERSEGESWKCEDGCNTCRCSAGQVANTIMLCQEPAAGKTCTDHNGVERSDGESWECEDECNTCSCSGGQVASTLILCHEPLPGLTCTDHNGVERRTGESWLCEDGCNTCRCSGDTITSTLILCIEPPPGLTCTDHNGVERSEGESWECEDECNTCVCKGGRVASTEIFCHGPPPGLSCIDYNGVERSEGESWQCEDGCNTCTCDGGRVASTKIGCLDGLGGGIEDTDINQEIMDLALSTISLLDVSVEGGSGCNNTKLVEVVNVRIQVVAGTNYFLTLRLANDCHGQREERLCENVGIHKPLSVYCKNPDGCLKLVRPQEISCRLFSQDSEGSCSFSHDCLKNGGSCALIEDASCVCNFGRCQVRSYGPGLWVEGVKPREKECSTYRDCPCRNQTDTCFCIADQCINEAWECHDDDDCYILNKCNSKQCTCRGGTCEWQCNTDDDCTRNNEAFYCQHDNYECRCENGQCNSLESGLDDSGINPIIEEGDDSEDMGPCTFSHDCLGDEAACRLIADASCVCNFGRCLVRGHDPGLWIQGVKPRAKECSTYRDCSCRNETDKCFCIGNQCVNEAWECHDDNDCSKLEKCEGKECSCGEGTCEWQCDTTEDCRSNNDAFYCQRLGYECKCELGQCESVRLEEQCVEPDYDVDDPEVAWTGITACIDMGKCQRNAPCQCLQNYCVIPWFVSKDGNCREEMGNKDCTDTILDCGDGSCMCDNVKQIDEYTRMGFCKKQ